MIGLETAVPRRKRVASRLRRWITNLSITALGAVLARVMALATVPLAATLAAAWAASHNIGFLNAVEWPLWLETAISLAFLDFAIWFQHLLSHRVAVLWRIHRVHHADRDFDATTALRFHPIEIGLSILYKVALALALGPTVFAVVLFEVALNGFALFNHANFAIPTGLDRWIRRLVVTPDFHRVHHSVHRDEHDSNYGFSLAIWDRLFRTYRAQPREGHDEMTIGLGRHQSAEPTQLGWTLLFPFLRAPPAERSSPKERD